MAKKQVLKSSIKTSENFYQSDLILKNYLNDHLKEEQYKSILKKLDRIGRIAATRMDELSQKADKNGPALKVRDKYGENIYKIDFHPSYQELVKIAIESGMFSVKWSKINRTDFGNRNKLSFGISSIYAMSEMGVYCPLCMTDGAAHLISRYCDEKLKEELLSGIASQDENTFLSGAMFLTEKAGGSDVGANLVEATKIENNRYALNGEKWFCSNANAEIIFVLARTAPQSEGTRGLSLFLLQPKKNKKPLKIHRLKDKLGVRSMASAEIELESDEAILIGEENKGFKLMTEMINVSRLYNSVAAVSASRRALIEAYEFTLNRQTFGKNLIQHVLIREKLEELGALNCANFYLTWEAISLLDKAEEGDEKSKEKLRIITPMVKKWSAENGVYLVRESMEIMGGIGYIEDLVIPKIMRDILVLPIWEGAGNIMFLDMLRASSKTKGLHLILEEIKSELTTSEFNGKKEVLNKFEELVKHFIDLTEQNSEEQQRQSKYLFESLTAIYQISILQRELRDFKHKYLKHSVDYLVKRYLNSSMITSKEALSEEEIGELLSWKV